MLKRLVLLIDVYKRQVQVDGAPVIGHEEQSGAIDQPQPVSPGRTDHPVRIWAVSYTHLNQADSMIFSTENQLKELGDKLPADKKAPIEAALQKLKDAHKAQDLAAIDLSLIHI